MGSRRTNNWPLSSQFDPVSTDLRRFEVEQARDDEEAERRNQKIAETAADLSRRRGDYDEAVRGATWADSPDHAAAHIAYVNGDHKEFGRLMAKIIDKELRDMAERLIDG